MANELAKVSFTGASLAKIDITTLQQGLVNAQDRVQVGNNVQFLKMLKQTGEWVYGAQEMDVEPGSRWAVNPLSLQTGFIAWGGGGKPLGKLMRSIFQPAVRREELQNVGKDWDENIAFQMQCITGEDTGTTVEYTHNSFGGRAAFAELVKQLTVQVDKVKGSSNPMLIVPVIVMASDSYKHQEFGRIFNPVFNVVDWMSMDGSAAEAPADQNTSQQGQGARQEARAQPVAQTQTQTVGPPPPQTRQRRFAAGTATVTEVPVQSAAPPANDPPPAEGVVRRRRRTATA